MLLIRQRKYIFLWKPPKTDIPTIWLWQSSSKNKTYKWISSLSERFSLVEMIATGIVYLKDNRTDTYQPFISGNGKYCRYDVEKGQIVEL